MKKNLSEEAQTSPRAYETPELKAHALQVESGFAQSNVNGIQDMSKWNQWESVSDGE